VRGPRIASTRVVLLLAIGASHSIRDVGRRPTFPPLSLLRGPRELRAETLVIFLVNSLQSKTALRYSRFIRAMFVIEITFGHTASHSPSFEQLPNPSASWRSIIATAR
jgi:hypothetical protein